MAKRKLKKASRGGYASRKRRTVTVASCPWDTGPDTAAQRAGKVIEDAEWTDPETGEKRNPNGVKRARRVDIAEMLHGKGYVSERGLKAAKFITEAFEQTQKSPPAIKKVHVDTSPKPDHAIAIQIDRISRYREAVRKIPPGCWGLVAWVCVDGRHPGSYPTIKALDMSNGGKHRLACRAFGKMIEDVAEAMGL